MAQDIGVIGAGSWGTALAMAISRSGNRAILWAHRTSTRVRLAEDGENSRYLPGFPFDENIVIASDEKALKDLSNILIVVPSHAMEETINWLKQSFENINTLAWATKGLESNSGHLMSSFIKELWPNHPNLAIVSGPSFAKEVASAVPTALTVAASNLDDARGVASWFQSESMRVYPSDDMVAVQLGGAVKNVLAIATGISDSLALGANARSALITRGLAEVRRLSDRLGGRNDTLMGLSGLGDLILTCTDDLSRNRRFGLLLGQGKSIDEALKEIGQEVEGIITAKALHQLAIEEDIEMPIVNQVYMVLYEDRSIQDAIASLMRRPAALKE